MIAVLGMHRSGTSCLAGTLEEAGLFLGRVSRQNPHNLKGNRENPRIMALHDDLLAANGGSWDDPPETVVWPDRLRAERDSIIGEYAGLPLWGFKDPRTLFTLEGWREALPGLCFVGTYRDPGAVARSLEARNRFPLATSLALWVRYNRRLLACQDRFGFPLVSFDLDGETYRAKVSRLIAGLGLTVPEGGLSFFEGALRRAGGAGDPLTGEAEEVYRELERRSL